MWVGRNGDESVKALGRATALQSKSCPPRKAAATKGWDGESLRSLRDASSERRKACRRRFLLGSRSGRWRRPWPAPMLKFLGEGTFARRFQGAEFGRVFGGFPQYK